MGPEYRDMRRRMIDGDLHTVCQEAGCPNIFECWEDREATFLIGGETVRYESLREMTVEVSRQPAREPRIAVFGGTKLATSTELSARVVALLADPAGWAGLPRYMQDWLATQAGVSREDAYRLVQRNAMKVWEQGADFKTELLADAEVTAALSPTEIEDKFDLGYHTKHVDTIFARVFGPEGDR